MIRELTWDSGFFKRKMGALRVEGKSLSQIKSSLKKAERDGFQYIICKIGSYRTDLIRFLEFSGFYLTDIGITWTIETGHFLDRQGHLRCGVRDRMEVAGLKDIPLLKKITKGLFVTSRFYHDPFFSRRDADNLYQTWVENSVRNLPDTIVFHVPKAGFIVCRKAGKKSGEIVLVGVKRGLQGKGLGSALIEHAMHWFKTEKVEKVAVRTQLSNLNAMNFYAKLGFHVQKFDIMFAIIFDISKP